MGDHEPVFDVLPAPTKELWSRTSPSRNHEPVIGGPTLPIKELWSPASCRAGTAGHLWASPFAAQGFALAS